MSSDRWKRVINRTLRQAKAEKGKMDIPPEWLIFSGTCSIISAILFIDRTFDQNSFFPNFLSQLPWYPQYLVVYSNLLDYTLLPIGIKNKIVVSTFHSRNNQSRFNKWILTFQRKKSPCSRC